MFDINQALDKLNVNHTLVSVGIAGYVSVCFAALLYVGFHCLSLHVSAYMAIFKGVGFFIYLFSYS
jgi:ABC-type arginine/histidine transport system permease subunit